MKLRTSWLIVGTGNFTSSFTNRQNYRHVSLVHTSNTSTRSIRKQSVTSPLGLAKTENNDNFSLFRLLFCSWLMLGLWSYACAYDDPYVALGLISFLCFAFMLMLMLSCESGHHPRPPASYASELAFNSRSQISINCAKQCWFFASCDLERTWKYHNLPTIVLRIAITETVNCKQLTRVLKYAI